jgi:ribonuclease T2
LDLKRLRLSAAIIVAALCVAFYWSGAVPLALEKRNSAADRISAPSSAASAPAADFDFYVLALSWSPSYCASKGNDADPQQCATAKPLGFTAHGLWPQFERGFPQDCDTSEGTVSRGILRVIDPVMPSDGLARHEWQKHGTCSGLSQADYFSALMQAVDKVRVPDMFKRMPTARRIAPSLVETAFLKANPGMSAKGFAAVCGGGYLSEVRICMTKDLNFRDCLEVDSKACRANTVDMPPAR